MAGRLIYIGKGEFIPGEPASDHDEPDEEKFQEKIASRIYRSESGKEIKEQQEQLKRAKTASSRRSCKSSGTCLLTQTL